MRIWEYLRQVALILITAVLMTTSVVPLDDLTERVRQYTRAIEFDYIAWTLDATLQKLGETTINPSVHVDGETQKQIVLKYFSLIRQTELTRAEIQVIYSNPAIADKESASAGFLEQESQLEAAILLLAPMAESILQAQVMAVLEEEGLGFLSQSLPPVLFHSSPLPMALIVSPREVVRQDVDISLLADLSLKDITILEEKVSGELNVSTLVVNVGGIGAYPTMVQRYSDMQWSIDTIAHEWAHNYLTLRPLGLNYETSPELRTMNETTASIVGSEISTAVLDRFYPDQAVVPAEGQKLASLAAPFQPFDFRREMHLTRIRVDALLKEGKVDEAEAYMEGRRQFFVKNGYLIRKLNQAYFAFYGAYADTPGGAAGQDPVGPAVRELRASSGSLAEFLRQIAGMNSFEDLQNAIH
jgi:hypothetical protein